MFTSAMQIIMEPQIYTAVSASRTSGQTDTGAGGVNNPNVQWVTPGQFALGTGGGGSNVGKTTNVDFTGWGFTIPSAAIIKGLLLNFLGSGNISYLGKLGEDIQLLKAGAPVGSIKGVGAVVTNPFQYRAGDKSDLWGTTWTPAEINAANFGIRYQVECTSQISGGWANQLSNFQLTVAYQL